VTRVVDVGAGHEPDPRATETADKYALDGIDHQFDIRETWPFDTETFDGVVMSHVLEHIADQPAVLREAARTVRPGGWIEVTVPVGDDAHADPDHDTVWTYATPEIY
jgi:predicted SAM-dependent methyltransferase